MVDEYTKRKRKQKHIEQQLHTFFRSMNKKEMIQFLAKTKKGSSHVPVAEVKVNTPKHEIETMSVDTIRALIDNRAGLVDEVQALIKENKRQEIIILVMQESLREQVGIAPNEDWLVPEVLGSIDAIELDGEEMI